MKFIKFVGFLMAIVCFFLTTIPIYPFFLLSPMLVRKILVRIVSFYSRIMLLILNIKIRIVDEHFLKNNSNYFIVSNHLSYLDVLILSSKIPSTFVTSKEVRNFLFLGHISRVAGCLFVDRKDKSHLKNEISELHSALEHGLNVTVFPEATSTNGESVLRFRKPLFASSVSSTRPTLPITINYLKVDGNQIGVLNRDFVCWYGEMDFFPHFLSLIEQSEVIAEIIIHEPIKPEAMEPLELAEMSHRKIVQYFRPLNLHLEESL